MRRLWRRRSKTEDEGTGELNIVPYLDVIMNLMMFVLLSMTGLAAWGVVNVTAPRQEPAGPRAAPATPVPTTVLVAHSGFFVAGPGGALDTSRPTIPAAPGLDFAALSDLLAAVKDEHPGETRLALGADPDIPYAVVVQTLDACRERGGRLLFPDASLVLPAR